MTVQMWPQNQGLADNVMGVSGAVYASVPGVPISVPDADVAALQANGWTTYATMAAHSNILMLPPAGATAVSFDGRQYSTTEGVPIGVPLFDVILLKAQGWTVAVPAVQS